MRKVFGLILVLSACTSTVNGPASNSETPNCSLDGTWSVTDTRQNIPSVAPECALLRTMPPTIETPNTVVKTDTWTEPSSDGTQSYVYDLSVDEKCSATISRQAEGGGDTVVVIRTLDKQEDGTLKGVTLVTLASTDACGVIYNTVAVKQ